MVLVLCMIFLAVFSVLAVSLASFTDLHLQCVHNDTRAHDARFAAESGLECAKYLVRAVPLDSSGYNYITDEQANKVWTDLLAYLQTQALDGRTVPAAARFQDDRGSGDRIQLAAMDLGDPQVRFSLCFYRYDDDLLTLKVRSVGLADQVSRTLGMDLEITKDSEVLDYAIASRGRMWLTGDTLVHGDIFSAWNRASVAPFTMTSDSAVRGTINTVLTRAQMAAYHYQLETLNGDGLPVDAYGNPLDANYEDRYYSETDLIQGYHEGIHYGQTAGSMPGMSISDYHTDCYNQGLADIPTCPTADREVEYFPHAAGHYNLPRDGTTWSTSNLKLTRHVYEDQTLTNVRVPDGRNALFRDCTFEGILYIDCSETRTSTSYCNNVRFENCTFNGVIVTAVPRSFQWMYNCLYFTGSAEFDNQSAVQEATILAPHFNVNLGNTNPEQSDNNVLTGAIVGGIVDVRGNAQINGTIISMCDTSAWTSGYVTNIGATLDDGGSETTELGDVGVISITPEQDQMLPSGITSPIVIRPRPETYTEGI